MAGFLDAVTSTGPYANHLHIAPDALPDAEPTVTKRGTENARLENAATNCRTDKRGKRHVRKAKQCTSDVVFNRISDTDERVLQCHSKKVA